MIGLTCCCNLSLILYDVPNLYKLSLTFNKYITSQSVNLSNLSIEYSVPLVNEYEPYFLMAGSTSEVTQCLNCLASGFFEPNIKLYNPDSLMKMVCGSSFPKRELNLIYSFDFIGARI